MIKYTLCGNPNGGCCPVVTEKDDGTVLIKDDDGDVISMTKEQYKIMCKKGCC